MIGLRAQEQGPSHPEQPAERGAEEPCGTHSSGPDQTVPSATQTRSGHQLLSDMELETDTAHRL